MPIIELISAALALVIFLMVFSAIRTCARELTAIRHHLDKLSPEAILHLKTTRRAAAADDVPAGSRYAADPERWLAERRAKSV